MFTVQAGNIEEIGDLSIIPTAKKGSHCIRDQMLEIGMISLVKNRKNDKKKKEGVEQ